MLVNLLDALVNEISRWMGGGSMRTELASITKRGNYDAFLRQGSAFLAMEIKANMHTAEGKRIKESNSCNDLPPVWPLLVCPRPTERCKTHVRNVDDQTHSEEYLFEG